MTNVSVYHVASSYMTLGFLMWKWFLSLFIVWINLNLESGILVLMYRTGAVIILYGV